MIAAERRTRLASEWSGRPAPPPQIPDSGSFDVGSFDRGASPAACVGVRAVDAAVIAYARGFEHPAKIRIVRWLARRLAAGRILVRHAPGAAIAVDPADYIGWAVLRTGFYEPASLGLALRIMTAEPGLFVDIGANFGWYTCALAAIAGTQVVSIEPDCANCLALRENIAANAFTNVVVANMAAGATFGTTPIARRAVANSGTIAIVSDTDALDRAGDWVATAPLDALLSRIVVPPVRPVLIKLDIEGFERQALAGLDFSGPFRPRNIIMEFEPSFGAWASLGDLLSFLGDGGYRVTDVFRRPVSRDVPLPEANIWAHEQAGSAS